MGGAYTAKPAVTTPVDVPPGWDDNWPRPGDPGHDPDPFFPAPLPPGYEPDYSFSLFGTASIAYDGTASITGTFRDHATYATNEPDPIRWTATVTNGSTRSVNLRFSGDEEYAYSILSDCAFVTYWSATPDIEFELTEEDDGSTVLLTGRSAITGSYVGASLEITIIRVAWNISFSLANIFAFDDTLQFGAVTLEADNNVQLPETSYVLPWTATVDGAERDSGTITVNEIELWEGYFIYAKFGSTALSIVLNRQTDRGKTLTVTVHAENSDDDSFEDATLLWHNVSISLTATWPGSGNIANSIDTGVLSVVAYNGAYIGRKLSRESGAPGEVTETLSENSTSEVTASADTGDGTLTSALLDDEAHVLTTSIGLFGGGTNWEMTLSAIVAVTIDGVPSVFTGGPETAANNPYQPGHDTTTWLTIDVVNGTVSETNPW